MTQAWNNTSEQENFVLSLLGNKKGGYYVELGAFHSKNGSNTNRLENEFDWKGVSFEIKEDLRKEFNENW